MSSSEQQAKRFLRYEEWILKHTIADSAIARVSRYTNAFVIAVVVVTIRVFVASIWQKFAFIDV